MVKSRMEAPAPAIDDIVLCARRAEEADLEEKEYERLQPQLKTVGLGKVMHGFGLRARFVCG